MLAFRFARQCLEVIGPGMYVGLGEGTILYALYSHESARYNCCYGC